MFTARFLQGLGSNWDVIVTNITYEIQESALATETKEGNYSEPAFSEILQKILDYDCCQKTGEIDRHGKALKSGSSKQQNPFRANTTNDSQNCSHCHRPGHSAEKCWSKHPHLRPKKGSKTSKTSKMPFHKPGLIAKFSKILPLENSDCAQKSDILSSHMTTLSHVPTNYFGGQSHNPNSMEPTPKIPKILSAMQCKLKTWYIDSEAHYHMTWNCSSFSSYTTVSNIEIQVADGREVPCAGTGDIIMSLNDQEIIIHDV